MGSTKCVIPGVHLKVFGRAIQSLSKIGDELYFEPLDEGLSLRTVNSSRSAYACFQFAPSFFITYITNSGSDRGDVPNEEGIRCKLTMKSVMHVFRSLSTIDKTVERCKITFNLQEDKLIFQMCCRHGIVKTHNLSFMECETLQAIFSRDLCPNKLTANPKLLCDAVINFQANQEEVTLLLRPDFVALKNYVEDEPNLAKVVHTELTLSPDEFDNFQVGVDADVTFCLKEFRAILAFADLTNLPMNLHIESPGRPITFSITSDLSFEANFVLATLAEPEDASEKPQSQMTTARSSYHSNKSQSNTTKKTSSKSKHQFSRQSSHTHENTHMREDSQHNNDDNEPEINDTTVVEPRSNGRSHSLTTNSVSNTNNNKNQRELFRNYEEEATRRNDSDRNHTSMKTNVNNGNRNGTQLNSTSIKKDGEFYVSASEESQSQHEMERARGRESDRNALSLNNNDMDEEMSQIIPIRDEHRTVTSDSTISNVANEEKEEEGDDDEQICGTPPSKRFRSLFFNTQSSTQSTIASQPKPAVLCPNSDSDD